MFKKIKILPFVALGFCSLVYGLEDSSALDINCKEARKHCFKEEWADGSMKERCSGYEGCELAHTACMKGDCHASYYTCERRCPKETRKEKPAEKAPKAEEPA